MFYFFFLLSWKESLILAKNLYPWESLCCSEANFFMVPVNSNVHFDEEEVA